MKRIAVPTKYKEMAAAILRQAEAEEGSNRFFIAAFDDGGITLYKQQIRALNLIFALQMCKRLQKKRSTRTAIAVIGGGAAGVTAAAAAMVLGYDVYLFERRPLLLHLQHGCDTRWVQPHLYNWPEPGSESPYAQLPLLDWQTGTAAEVTEQIMRSFDNLIKADSAGRIYIHRGATTNFEDPEFEALRIRWGGSQDKPATGAKDISAVIFAVGFGVEWHVERRFTQSYWRNDSLNQPEPGALVGKETDIVISGTGDGGLTDLLRACIESYSQGRIVRDLFNKDDEELLASLLTIKKQWETEKPVNGKTWLYNKYTDLAQKGLTENIRTRLSKRLRGDTKVQLNGRAASLSYALNLDQASLLSTFLTHTLEELQAFSYKPGKCTPSPAGVKIGSTLYSKDKFTFFIRHGTNNRAVFKELKCEKDIGVLKVKSKEVGRLNTSIPIWPAGWWQRHQLLGGERKEFISPATLAIATTFVSTLSDIIKLLHTDKRELQFRVTLHRLIKVQGEEFFQQISYYAGTRLDGAPGRIFDVKRGLGGLACRLGRTVIVRRNEDFEQIWGHLGLKGLDSKPINRNVKALLACPFFSPVCGSGGPTHVSLLLFMDSGQENFFDGHNKQVLQNIYTACKGFVANLERMRGNGEVTFSSSEYTGHKFYQRKEDLKLLKKYPASLDVESTFFDRFRNDLAFKSISFFDLHL